MTRVRRLVLLSAGSFLAGALTCVPLMTRLGHDLITSNAAFAMGGGGGSGGGGGMGGGGMGGGGMGGPGDGGGMGGAGMSGATQGQQQGQHQGQHQQGQYRRR